MILRCGRGAFWLLLATLACTRQPVTAPAPNGGWRSSRLLPPVPEARGPLALRVIYPAADAVVDVRDSSFLFGSAGAGDAQLTINGQPVQVWPNGAWIAWVPFPHDSLMAFELRASTPRDSAQLTHIVRRAARFEPSVAAGVWIDTTSLAPRGRVWLPSGEYLTLSARAAEGATLRLRLADGTLVPLAPDPRAGDTPPAVRAFDLDTTHFGVPVHGDRYAGLLRGRAVGTDPGPAAPPVDGAQIEVPPAADSNAPMLEAIRGADTARVHWPLQLALLDTLPGVIELNDDPTGLGDTDSITVGRAAPGATYNWFFPTGTRAAVTGRINGELRIRLGPELNAWVAASEARSLPPGTPAPRAVVGSLTLKSMADRVVLRIPVGRRLPFRLSEDDHTVSLSLYGGVGDVNWIRYSAGDSLVRQVTWNQRGSDELGVDVALSRSVWGYRARWSGTDLLLEIRRPPAVDRGHPLRGRLLVIDPGHPPAGATGPTGLTEAEANLGIALRLRALLEADGAKVVLTRSTGASLDLWPRVKLADSVGADLLVSIHNNALPDGLNPFSNSGSTVFYNHPLSIPLAGAIQHHLVERLGLRDLGIGRGDLALTRPTWMPAVLCEGLYMILPDQEAALRSPEGQELYARAVYEGIRDFLGGRGR